MPIPCPHFKITIVKRSQGQSAVAGAAYQSGERLFSEYDQKTKFYNKKKELVHAEIMLPSHAPPGFADRATLWNAVEAVENQWNSQLARRIVLAFPVEVPKEQYLSMIKEFCQEQFVAKGMIADFAIHDKGDGNPHAHILLTLRAMDEHGKWLPKARKVYDLDENGERIRLASGNWKCHKENTVDWTLPSYYDWELKQTVALHPGVKYTYYEFTNLPRKMHVLELDLTNDAVEISTSMADDLVPNPNGNNNSNNGKNIRETLSENCNRKRAEGQNIIAGINSGFFNSHDGFPRGLHIEEGRPDFVNNKSVRTSLTNHANAFTFFKDRTVSCGKKTFSGKIEVGGTEYEYHSINDTILRSGSTLQEANLYTARYKKIPHPDAPSLTNTLSKKALYVVAKNKSGNPVTVNDGWFEATVTQIADGRSTELAEAPYLTALDEWAVQLTGATAETLAGKLSVGSTLRIRADVTVNGISTPILTQNSTMYQFMVDGEDKSFDTDKYDPMTYVGIDKAGTKVCFFVIDGRQDWISMGVKFYEMVRIAQKFDCWNVTRFDGGGSTAMWLYTDGAGKVVNQPSDAKGERSCMNYLHVRIKQ
mgnify:CR=1 FL=1